MSSTILPNVIKRSIFWMLPISAHAQLLTNQGAVLSSTAGVTISVNGDVLNQGAGLFDNNGLLTISGDLTHNAANTCFGTSQGEVLLNGGSQHIGGTSVAVFNHLELAGAGNKTLLQDVEVGGAYTTPAGVLRLNDRVLDLNVHELTVRNSAPSAITRSTGYIVSETDPIIGCSYVRWDIGTCTGTYTIPFGNAATNAYLPFVAAITTPGVGASGHVRMATYPTNTLPDPNNRPLPAGMPNLIDMSGVENAAHVLDRWWVMEQGGYSAAPLANVQFSYRDNEWSTGSNIIAESALQLERQAGVWNMMPTVINTAGNTLLSNGQPLITSFWTAAEVGSPLPVEILSFTAHRADEREVRLDWTTASERDNAGFEVWRMIEGESDFAEVAWVDGAVNSQQLINYEHPDENNAQITSYYKLKQVDHDGQYTWTRVVAVEGAERSTTLMAYPNPAHDSMVLTGLPENISSLALFDGSGHLLREWGRTNTILGLGDLGRGVYLLTVLDANGEQLSMRVVLE